MNGKFVPKTSERMLAIARQQSHTFITQPKVPRCWLWRWDSFSSLLPGTRSRELRRIQEIAAAIK
ncbi:MAG: hypothetical protein Q4C95_00910 [Planctomycetia bacterium]|nr:hypothetical protein [Planctomycetia bacterium]